MIKGKLGKQNECVNEGSPSPTEVEDMHKTPCKQECIKEDKMSINMQKKKPKSNHNSRDQLGKESLIQSMQMLQR